MGLIKSRRYPEYDTYIGKIHRSSIEYKAARFPGLDRVASNIINNAVENEIYKSGGRLLEVSVYSENSWWGIIPIYVLKTEFKWYMPGEYLAEPLPAVIAAIAWAIAVILIAIAVIYYAKRYFDVVEKHGYPPWYESLFGKVALVIVVGVGGYITIKFLAPYLYQKIYKEKKT